MEQQGDLQAASNYINNVLLARGLVKSGRPIDFANPENEEGGVATTMARIINLVNDLVLRRDVSLPISYTSILLIVSSVKQNIERT
jgi:hypothetical protein